MAETRFRGGLGAVGTTGSPQGEQPPSKRGEREGSVRPRFDNRSWVDHPFVGGKGCLTFHPWWPAGLSSRVHAVVTQCGEPGALADRPLAKECFVF